MSDDKIRDLWAAYAARLHCWPAGAVPERGNDGRFVFGSHEWEYQIFRAGVFAAHSA
jgi:hypothetical protein